MVRKLGQLGIIDDVEEIKQLLYPSLPIRNLTVTNQLVVSPLTENRLAIVGADGLIEDDANLTWDGSDLTVGGSVIVQSGSNDTQLNFTNLAGEGGYLTSTAAADAILTGGMDYVGGSWYARHTAAGGYQINNGIHYWYGNTGLTVDITMSPTARMSLSTVGLLYPTGGIRTKHSTADVSNPPTDAELDSAFGTPATVGAGFLGTLDDNGAGSNVYFVFSDGSNWWYRLFVKAT
jgi:hypothetical protein